MRKPATTAVAGAALLGVVLAGASPSVHAAGATAPSRSQHVMRVKVQVIEVKAPTENHPIGVDRLRSLATGKIAGYDNWSALYNPGNDHLRFWMTLSLDGGTIDTYFSLTPGPSRFTGQILRGYGKYRGIDGTIHVRRSDTAPRTVYTLRYML
jgi:hypothetical protein